MVNIDTELSDCCRKRILLLFFFFFKQKTAYEMRISDWSSDVCSSDLLDHDLHRFGRGGRETGGRKGEEEGGCADNAGDSHGESPLVHDDRRDRKSVV